MACVIVSASAPLLQFDIDIPLQFPVGGSHFGAQRILHPDHAPGHCGMAETDTCVMPRLRRSSWREQGKPRAEHRQRARIPACPDNGRCPMMDGHLVDCVLMGMKGLSMQRGAVHDRNSMLKDLIRGLHDGVRRHAEERGVDIPRLTDVGCHWNGSKHLCQLSICTGRSTHNGCHTEIVAQGNEFRAGLSYSAESDDCETHWFHV